MTPEEIRAAREALMLTRAEYGRIVGASRQAVRSWEEGERSPDRDHAEEVAYWRDFARVQPCAAVYAARRLVWGDDWTPDRRPMRKVCAWCLPGVRIFGAPTTHGICERCLAVALSGDDKYNQEPADGRRAETEGYDEGLNR